MGGPGRGEVRCCADPGWVPGALSGGARYPSVAWRVVAAERDCCGWARWEVTDEGDCSVLEVTGPPGRIGRLASAFGI